MECGDSRFVMLESELPKEVFEFIKEYIISERLDAGKRLAGWFAHEINNPLGAVLGSAQLLERRLANDVIDPAKLETYKKYLDMIQNQIDRCARVTGESLSIFDIGWPTIERINVSEVVSDAISLVRCKYPHAELKIAQDCDVPCIKADRQWLIRIIFELITNALEECPEMPVGIQISSRGRSNNSRVLIRVEDSCCGIPENIRWKIFVPFFSTREKSCGVGLSLSQEMALRMNGNLILENANKEGSVFLISLPAWEIIDG